MPLTTNTFIPDHYIPPGKKLIKRYRPIVKVSRPQYEFCTSSAKYDGYIGGRGAGKSYAGCLKARQESMLFKCTGCVVAPTYPMIRDIIWPAWLDVFNGYFKDPNRPIHKGDKYSELRNGSVVLFRSADNPDNLRGPNLSWFWIDEAALLDDYAWKILVATLREDGRPGRGWTTTTPRGKDWLFDKFTKSDNDKYKLVHASTFDNPFTSQDYKNDLVEEYGIGWFERQEIQGEFCDPAGALFQRQWFKYADETELPDFDWIYRGWDLAVDTKETSDYTVGAKVGVTSNMDIYILDIIRGRYQWPDAREIIIETAIQDGADCFVNIESVAFQKAAYQELIEDNRFIAPLNEIGPKGKNKAYWALPVASRAKAGKVYLLRAPWNKDFVDEACMFSGDGKTHDDQVDGVSIALREVLHQPTVRVTSGIEDNENSG